MAQLGIGIFKSFPRDINMGARMCVNHCSSVAQIFNMHWIIGALLKI
jgi:hypothetical protein